MSKINLIVTRHAGLVEWLRLRGIEGDVVAHATTETVRDRHVFGVLPLNLAAVAASVTNVDMPRMTAEQRGKDLTPAEMDTAGAELVRYVVLTEDESLALREVASVARAAAEIADDSRYDGHYVEELEKSLRDVRTSFWGDEC